MLKKILRPLAGAVILTLAGSLALVAPPAAADDGKKTIRFKKIHRVCDGENCESEKEHGEHRAIFIGEGGELHEIDDFIGHGGVWFGTGERSGTFLGVQLADLTPELRAHFGTPEGQGVLVSKVADGSPAAIAGVQVGDVVTAVDGEAVRDGAGLGRLIRQRDEGETVALEVYRDGRIEILSPTLEKRERPKARLRHLHGGHGKLLDVFEMYGGHKVMVSCDEGHGEEDCEVIVGDLDTAALSDYDCGGAESCKVEVHCDSGGCECTANGDAVDCDELPGFTERHGG